MWSPSSPSVRQARGSPAGSSAASASCSPSAPGVLGGVQHGDRAPRPRPAVDVGGRARRTGVSSRRRRRGPGRRRRAAAARGCAGRAGRRRARSPRPRRPGGAQPLALGDDGIGGGGQVLRRGQAPARAERSPSVHQTRPPAAGRGVAVAAEQREPLGAVDDDDVGARAGPRRATSSRGAARPPRPRAGRPRRRAARRRPRGPRRRRGRRRPRRASGRRAQRRAAAAPWSAGGPARGARTAG